jgi:PAS domain S-box-containing protein
MAIRDDVARLAAIVNSSDDAILSTDLNGIITSWNPAAERIYGYSASEVIGRANDVVVPSDRLAEEHEIRVRIAGGEEVAHYETVRVRKDGRRIDVALTVSPLRAEDGGVVGVCKIARDVTERKRLDRLKDEWLADARRLAAIVESTEDAVIGMTLDGTITAWNLAAERMYGYTAVEAIGRSIRIVLPPERQQEESLVLDRVRRGERLEHFETIRCRRDASCVPVSLTVSPIRDESGAVVGASKIARDITDRKRNAERTAFLAEAGAVLAGSLDYMATLKTVANLAVPSIADWCAVDVLTDDKKLDRVAVAHVDPTKIEMARTVQDRYEDPSSPYSPSHVVRTGRPALLKLVTDDMIVAAARGDAERIRLVRLLGLTSVIAVPLTAHGRTFGVLTLVTAESGRTYADDDFQFAQDVAFRAALAVDNARAYDTVQLANRLKDEFLATLSHELRTPLNAILGYARLVQSGAMTPERQARAVGTIQRNATALTQIIEDILDVSRIVAGKVRLNIQAIDLPVIVKEAIEALLPAADAKQMRVQTVLDPRAAPVSGDPDRLQQIVWNLVANAVKFTPKNGVVQVRLERVNSHVELTVSDTGIGISPDFLPHIFERFRQGDAGPSREHGGLGLGLAIVRHLVELHGGTVHASSGGKDRGATFQVRLPIMIVHPTTVEDRRVHPTTGTPGFRTDLPRLNDLRVLAVDDDADARGLITEILETAGARVTTVDSAAQAIEMFERVRPDVLIADIGLAGSDGFELIVRVRQSPDTAIRGVPAAALTAYARAEDRVKALKSGFDMHLAKPIDPAELVVAVSALSKRKA